MVDLTDLRIGDIIETRKPHPCGSYQWTVVRLGADIGLRCRTCGHKVLLPRQRLGRAARTVIHPQNTGDDTDRPAGSSENTP